MTENATSRRQTRRCSRISSYLGRIRPSPRLQADYRRRRCM